MEENHEQYSEEFLEKLFVGIISAKAWYFVPMVDGRKMEE